MRPTRRKAELRDDWTPFLMPLGAAGHGHADAAGLETPL